MKGSMISLRERLKMHGLTLKEVAIASGESQSTVSRVLNETLQNKIQIVSEKLITDRKAQLTNA